MDDSVSVHIALVFVSREITEKQNKQIYLNYGNDFHLETEDNTIIPITRLLAMIKQFYVPVMIESIFMVRLPHWATIIIYVSSHICDMSHRLFILSKALKKIL